MRPAARLLERPSRRAFGAPQDEEVVQFHQTATHSSGDLGRVAALIPAPGCPWIKSASSLASVLISLAAEGRCP